MLVLKAGKQRVPITLCRPELLISKCFLNRKISLQEKKWVRQTLILEVAAIVTL